LHFPGSLPPPLGREEKVPTPGASVSGGMEGGMNGIECRIRFNFTAAL
jgi:hypothetical protein